MLAIKHLGNIRINASLPKLADLIENAKSTRIRQAVQKNMPVVASNALFNKQKITAQFALKNDQLTGYFSRHIDWVNQITDFQGVTKKIIENNGSYHGLNFIGLISSTGLSSTSFLIKALDDENKDVFTSAYYALLKIQSPQAIQPLIKVLDDNEFFVSIALVSIADTLRNTKNPQAIQALIKVLDDEDKDIRSLTANILGEIKSPQTIQPLIKALDDKDKDVRSSAANALGNFESSQAIQPLIKALDDEDKDVRSSAANALDEIQRRISNNTQFIPLLIKYLANKNLSVAAAGQLEATKSPQAIQALIKALADKNKNTRDLAAQVLGNIKSPQAIRPLIK